MSTHDRRVAFITDIHGHLPGLQAVLGLVQSRGIGRVVCLGDLVDGGDQNAGVIQELRSRGIPCVQGNHDENPMSALSPEDRSWLRSLPLELVIDGGIATHISPLQGDRKLNTAHEAMRVFEESPHEVVFVGHVHYPIIFGRDGGESGGAKVHRWDLAVPFVLDARDRWIVVVGPVGYSRDLYPHPRYAIWDPVARTIEMRAVRVPLLRMDTDLLR